MHRRISKPLDARPDRRGGVVGDRHGHQQASRRELPRLVLLLTVQVTASVVALSMGDAHCRRPVS